jgi:hypothetical protein
MQESTARHSLEEILTEIEQDEGLRGQGSSSESQTARTAEQGEVASEGGVGLGALLSHPELLAKLPLLLKAVQTLTEPVAGSKDCKRPDSPVALLCALRPYLNDNRRQALDTMIRVSKLSESLRSLH